MTCDCQRTSAVHPKWTHSMLLSPCFSLALPVKKMCVSATKLTVYFRLDEMKGLLWPGNSRGSPTVQDKGPGLAVSHACVYA